MPVIWLLCALLATALRRHSRKFLKDTNCFFFFLLKNAYAPGRAVAGQPPAVTGQPLSISRQTPAVDNQILSVNRQPLSVELQPPSVTSQPPSFGGRLGLFYVPQK